MLFKLSNLNTNLALTLGYLEPALNDSAVMKNTTNSRKKEKDWTGTWSSPHTLQVQNGGPANLMK